MQPYWHKQTPKEPLFPNLLWARPENRAHAGKLLVVGGTGQGFAAAADAYGAAEKAGAGTVRVVLPSSLYKTVGKLFPAAEFAPATPSGSFAISALAELLAAATWAEGVVLAGDTGNNSETTRLFEAFLEKYTGQLTLCGDSIDVLVGQPVRLLDRGETTLVLSFAQLQKLAIAAHHPEAFTSDMGLVRLVETLHSFEASHAANLIVMTEDTVIAAAEGQVSTTPVMRTTPGATAATAAVWWLQNPTQPFAALTTSQVL